MLPFAVKVMFRAAFLYGSTADGDVFSLFSLIYLFLTDPVIIL